jgi:hypothetical protein
MARQRIELQPEEAGELRRRRRAGTVSVRERRRSEIILLSAEADAAADCRADGDIAPAGQPLGRAFCAGPTGGIERCAGPRTQAVAG